MHSLSVAAIERAQGNLRVALDSAGAARGDSHLDKLARQVDVPAAVLQLTRGLKPGGAAGEYSAEMEKLSARTSQNSVRIPWSIQQRALSSDVAAAGAYLVATHNAPPAQALVPVSAAAALGATIIQTDAPFNVPRITASASTPTLNSDTSTVAPSTPTFGQAALSPKHLGAYVEISRQMLLQSDAQQLMQQHLMAAVGARLDALALMGSGTAGEPTGVANTAGIQSFSGSSLALATLLSLQDGAGDALDATAGFASHAAVAKLLRARSEISGSSKTLWEGPLRAGMLTDLPARTSTALTGKLLFGCWSHLLIAIWSGGLELAVNPYANFQSGLIGVRVLAHFDCACIWPAAFAANSSTVT